MKSKLTCVRYIFSALCISASSHISEKTMVMMSPAELSLLYAMKGGGSKQGQEGSCDWAALSDLGDRLTGKLSPGCLADPR